VPDAVWQKHKATAEEASHRPVSRWGAAMIALIWIIAAAWLALLVWGGRYY